MQLKDRIDSCLSALEQKRLSVDTFQSKVRKLIESLKVDGMNPSTLEEILQSLESVLKEYSEISATCQEMVHGLRDIGDYMTRIETGRQKILTGVESILKNLSHLDRLAQNGMQVGAGPSGSPRRILLVRIAPDGEQANRPARVEEDDDEAPAGDTVVH